MGGAVLTLVEARAVLASSPFATWWRLDVQEVGPDTATVILPTAPHLMRPGGVLQGAGYDVVADVATWLAQMTRDGVDSKAVTAELKTNFLASTADDIACTATVHNWGRRLVFGTAQTHDAGGRDAPTSRCGGVG
jgi:acyl-coenzyme A thioesterase PaaI-like protein